MREISLLTSPSLICHSFSKHTTMANNFDSGNNAEVADIMKNNTQEHAVKVVHDRLKSPPELARTSPPLETHEGGAYDPSASPSALHCSPPFSPRWAPSPPGSPLHLPPGTAPPNCQHQLEPPITNQRDIDQQQYRKASELYDEIALKHLRGGISPPLFRPKPNGEYSPTHTRQDARDFLEERKPKRRRLAGLMDPAMQARVANVDDRFKKYAECETKEHVDAAIKEDFDDDVRACGEVGCSPPREAEYREAVTHAYGECLARTGHCHRSSNGDVWPPPGPTYDPNWSPSSPPPSPRDFLE